MTPEVLMLLIAYKNMDEVEAFVNHVRSMSPEGSVAFAVCDNSPQSDLSRFDQCEDIVTTSRPDNPGYLDGGISALTAYLAVADLPDWVIISNTDLAFRSQDMASILSTYHDCDTPIVIAPRITEGDDATEMNPHVVERRSRSRLRINRILAATSYVALIYLASSSLRRRTGHPRRRASQGNAPLAETGTRMFSPYGAMIIFSRAFISQVGLPLGVPLLAEEHAIGLTAARSGSFVTFENRIHAHHEGHTTTGPAITLRRARMLHRAFRFIDRIERRQRLV